MNFFKKTRKQFLVDSLFFSSFLTTSFFNKKNEILSYQNIAGINIKEFGAIGNGKIDDTQSIVKALKASIVKGIRTIIVPEGKFLVTSSIHIPDGDLTLIGTGNNSILLKHKKASSIFFAEKKNGIKLQNIKFNVEGNTPGFVQEKELIRFYQCHDLEVKNCIFDAFNDQGQLTLFALLNTPSCDRGVVKDCYFTGSFGNCCGPQDGDGDGKHGQYNTFINNKIEYFADTGIGLWTNTRFNKIIGNRIRGLKLSDNIHDYPGVGIDIAGASDSVIQNNIIEGSNIGIRILTQLKYTNERILVRDNQIKGQNRTSLEHPAIGIKLSHDRENMSATIIDNNIEVNEWGIAIFSVISEKQLQVQIDSNKFFGEKGLGLLYQGLNKKGNIKFVPGTNNFELNYPNAQAVDLPNQSIGEPKISFNISSQIIRTLQNLHADRGKHIFDQVELEAGLYGVHIKFGRMSDVSGVGANASLYGENIVLSAAQDHQESFFTVRVPFPGLQSFYTVCHPAGHNHNIRVLQLVRLA